MLGEFPHGSRTLTCRPLLPSSPPPPPPPGPMTSPAQHPAATPTRYAGLDGLRAVAVALVVLYHLFPGALVPGGFVGVDVFFVISGFLITTLLLREHRSTGRISLVDFRRSARPAARARRRRSSTPRSRRR